MSKWFATQVDRDFNSFYDHDTMLYGNGIVFIMKVIQIM